MRKLLHKIAHILHWNYGECHSFYKKGKLYMSFRCSGCGKLSGIHCIDDLIDNGLIK